MSSSLTFDSNIFSHLSVFSRDYWCKFKIKDDFHYFKYAGESNTCIAYNFSLLPLCSFFQGTAIHPWYDWFSLSFCISISLFMYRSLPLFLNLSRILPISFFPFYQTYRLSFFIFLYLSISLSLLFSLMLAIGNFLSLSQILHVSLSLGLAHDIYHLAIYDLFSFSSSAG